MVKKQNTKFMSQQFLRVLMKFLSGLTEDEFQGILDGAAKLTLMWEKSPQTSQERQKRFFNEDDPTAIQALKKRLQASLSASAAIVILEESGLTRVQLERIARSFDLPILKEDNVARLIEKISEATVGSKLSSKAVRGR